MDEGAHPWVDLARGAIRHYGRTNEILRPGSRPDDPPPCGVYVTVEHLGRTGEVERQSTLGSPLPGETTLRDEIAHAAVLAAYAEPGAKRLKDKAIERLSIVVHLLGEPELIHDNSELDPSTFGVLVRPETGRVGLVLPNTPGIETSSDQVAEAKTRSGLSRSEEVGVYRFSVTSYR